MFAVAYGCSVSVSIKSSFEMSVERINLPLEEEIDMKKPQDRGKVTPNPKHRADHSELGKSKCDEVLLHRG